MLVWRLLACAGGKLDRDGDGFSVDAGDCDDDNASIYPGAVEIWYDGVDQDCAADNDYDADLDSFTSAEHGGTDCDDSNPSVNPAQTDTPFADGNCDGNYSNSLAGASYAYTGENDGDWAGVALTATGDVDADGVPDMLVGARYNSDNGERAGKIYLLSGAQLGQSTDLGSLPSFVGETPGDWLGYAVGYAGDTNGDGVAELLMAGLHHQNDRGAVYLVNGGSDLNQQGQDVAQRADLKLLGEEEGDLLGVSVYAAGDVDGDQRSDLLIGAHKAGGSFETAPGKAYLVLSSGLISQGGEQSVADASYVFLGENAGDETGRFVSGVEDFDGDGLAELMIASPWSDQRGEDAGTIYVVRSSSLPPPSGAQQTINLGDADHIFQAEGAGDFTGHAVLDAGDVDGDGKGDLMVGSMYNDYGGEDVGRAYLILGASLSDTGTIELSDADYKFAGEKTGDRAGRLVGSAGDMDDDGLSDVVIGAFGNDDAADMAGKTYFVMGNTLGASSTISLSDIETTVIGERNGDASGQTATGIGDVNQDGRDDVLIGAFRNDDIAQDAGKVYILLSSL